MTYDEAQKIIIEHVIPVSSEKISLSECAGRISAEDITAKINVPSFDRSPYDGFAFMAGEDIKAGNILVRNGEIIDTGRASLIASQGISEIGVYRRPIIGIISTGSELTDIHLPLTAGKIYNTNRYTLETALMLAGFIPEFFGTAYDDENETARMMSESLSSCDALVVTGGVSAGDYDIMPEALKILRAKILVRDIAVKPGGKCIYAVKDNRLICCLSGNPASALTNYYAVALPAMKKLSGLKDFMPSEAVNSVDDVTISTLPNHYPVNKNSRIASMRIIPLVTHESNIIMAENICRGKKLISLLPYKPMKAGIIITGSEIYHGLIHDKFEAVAREKLSHYPCEPLGVTLCDDDSEMLDSAIASYLNQNADIIIMAGGMSFP